MGDAPMRRALHILSIALITAGVVIMADVAMTLAWKEPLSTIYGSIQQGKAADELERLEGEFPADADLRAVADTRDVEKRAALLADLYSERVRSGEGIGRILIPGIDVDTVVVEGTEHLDPAEGAGPLPGYRLPGSGQDDRHRRPPDHLPGALPAHRRDRRRRRDHARDALRDLHLRGREA